MQRESILKADYSLVLATDLDGTFLGGTDQMRSEFYEYLQQRRDRMLLIFVTGRDLGFIERLYAEPGFPQPDYIIGDVGTTIVHGDTFKPLPEVQNWVTERWGNANERIKRMMANEPGIKLQPVATERRVSYYYQPEELQPSTVQKVIDAGFDCILSADIFLDVMPRGIAKGPTLLKLMEVLQLKRENVIPAGDTLNDLSLFETGLSAIAVGNSEPKLVEKIQTMENVYHSPHPGVAGIWDGIKVYGKHQELVA